LPWAVDISETGWYGFPSLEDGTLKVANHGPGSRIHPSERSKVPAGDEARFRGFFKEYLPSLVDAPRIGSRLCFYADRWNGDLYIDSVPGYEGLTVATGGSGHAFKFAPELGDLIANIVEGVDNAERRRFRWRVAGERQTEEARYA
jgi:glycine/D-amino acid oxidase-like deaminating enzyme